MTKYKHEYNGNGICACDKKAVFMLVDWDAKLGVKKSTLWCGGEECLKEQTEEADNGQSQRLQDRP